MPDRNVLAIVEDIEFFAEPAIRHGKNGVHSDIQRQRSNYQTLFHLPGKGIQVAKLGTLWNQVLPSRQHLESRTKALSNRHARQSSGGLKPARKDGTPVAKRRHRMAIA